MPCICKCPHSLDSIQECSIRLSQVCPRFLSFIVSTKMNFQRGRLANVQEKVTQTFKRMSWIFSLPLSTKAQFCKYIQHCGKGEEAGKCNFPELSVSDTSSLCLTEKMVVFVEGVIAFLRTGTSTGTHFPSLWGLSYFHGGFSIHPQGSEFHSLHIEMYMPIVIKSQKETQWCNSSMSACISVLSKPGTRSEHWTALCPLFTCLWSAWCVVRAHVSWKGRVWRQASCSIVVHLVFM